jgi:hypothetical protein
LLRSLNYDDKNFTSKIINNIEIIKNKGNDTNIITYNKTTKTVIEPKYVECYNIVIDVKTKGSINKLNIINDLINKIDLLISKPGKLLILVNEKPMFYIFNNNDKIIINNFLNMNNNNNENEQTITAFPYIYIERKQINEKIIIQNIAFFITEYITKTKNNNIGGKTRRRRRRK